MERSAYEILREEMLAWVRSRIKPGRYEHTLGVEKEALILAERFHSDSDPDGRDSVDGYLSETRFTFLQLASIAAILHDNAKSLSKDELAAISKEAFPDLRLSKKYFPVLHAFAGSVEAKKRFPDLPSAVYDSIAYHTTGRPCMSMLEKIIYCADFTEQGRKPFDGLDDARKLLEKDLDEGMLFILKHTAAYVQEEDDEIHPLTMDTIRYYEKERDHHGKD